MQQTHSLLHSKIDVYVASQIQSLLTINFIIPHCFTNNALFILLTTKLSQDLCSDKTNAGYKQNNKKHLAFHKTIIGDCEGEGEGGVRGGGGGGGWDGSRSR